MSDVLQVEWILPDGRGGGRWERGTFRAAGALPGQHLRAIQSKKRGRTLDVQAYETLLPSPYRSPHACVHQTRCGGCDLGQLNPQVRADGLREMVRRALRHENVEWVASPRPERHRARIKLGLTPDGVGYLAPRSHELVPVRDCLAARSEIAQRIPDLSRVDWQGGTVEIRSNGVRTVLAFEGTAVPPTMEDCASNGKTVRGDPTLVLTVAGLSLRASPRSFFQVNLEGNEALVARVTESVMAVAPERVLDLYSGIGNLSLPIAARGVPVTAVEMEGQATSDLTHNAARNGLEVTVHTRRVERFDPSRTAFDVVVLDPPRAGCSGVVKRLLMQRPRRIVLVSCNIVSAARDIQPALQAGYRITEVTALDLFPDTHHVETLIVLDRS